MPIAAESRHHYGREWRTVTRPRILDRAQHACEWCGRRDRERQFVGPDGSWVDADAAERELSRDGIEVPDDWRLVRTVLTIAHLNHVAGDDRDGNLAALCQRCHLTHDGKQHATSAARTRDRRRGQVRMFPEATP